MIFADFITINSVFHFGVSLLQYINATNLTAKYFSILYIYNLFWFASSILFGLYRINNTFSIDYIHRSTWKTILLQQLIIVFYFYIDADTSFTRMFLIIEFSLLVICLLFVRFIFTILFYTIGKNIYVSKKSMIIGNNNIGIKLAHFFESKPLEYSFCGFLDVKNEQLSIQKLDDYFIIAYSKCIENVFLIIDNKFNFDPNELYDISEKYGIKLKLVHDLDEIHFTGFTSKIEEGFEFYSYRKERLEELTERFKKRVLDILFSFFVIVFILSWLFPILYILIKLDSKGPVIFKQIRNGRSNKPFYCFKFRSMKVNVLDPSIQATKNDSRFTKIGAFIRKTNLDEMPQFINVLLGDMSVVGPRPHMTVHNDQYRKIIEKYLVRNYVKPGITGWAQVNGFRGETKNPLLMEKRVLKDIEYLENWSLMFDIRIIFLTIFTSIKGDSNAY